MADLNSDFDGIFFYKENRTKKGKKKSKLPKLPCGLLIVHLINSHVLCKYILNSPVF